MKRLEDFWREIQQQWVSHAFAFSRNTFQDIVTDIAENQYSPAEAIVKHIAEGSGINPPEFARLMAGRLSEPMTHEAALEFVDGYGKLTTLLQAGFFLAVEGPHATEEMMRQWQLSMKRDRVNFLADNIETAAGLIKQDPTGRTMMIRLADAMTRTSRRNSFNEGVLTAADTFMAYSKTLEESMNGTIS